MISESVVDLSRLQFAMTAMYHFLFVPLTLGLAFLLLPLAVGTLSLFCRRFGSTPGAGTPSPGGGL